jgi:hypothetical protein
MMVQTIKDSVLTTIPTYHYLSHLEEGLITTTKHPLNFKNKINQAII